MDAQIWFTVSIVGYSLAGVLFIVAIFMFFKMNILSIIGDLSGRTAAKQIQMIREQNTLTGNKRHMPNSFNVDRGKLTEPVGFSPDRSVVMGKTAQTIANESKRLDIKGQTVETSRPTVIESLPTAVLNDRESLPYVSIETTVLSEETVVLTSENETMVLNETVVLGQEQNTTVFDETVVLVQENETTVLNPTAELENEKEPPNQKAEFKIIKDIKITHTNEMI